MSRLLIFAFEYNNASTTVFPVTNMFSDDTFSAIKLFLADSVYPSVEHTHSRLVRAKTSQKVCFFPGLFCSFCLLCRFSRILYRFAPDKPRASADHQKPFCLDPCGKFPGRPSTPTGSPIFDHDLGRHGRRLSHPCLLGGLHGR